MNERILGIDNCVSQSSAERCMALDWNVWEEEQSGSENEQKREKKKNNSLIPPRTKIINRNKKRKETKATYKIF